MASAMEKMVAGMLGITPEEMSAMMTGFQDLLKNLAVTLKKIEEQGEANHALLLELLEGMKNGSGIGERKSVRRGGNLAITNGSGGAGTDAIGSGD